MREDQSKAIADNGVYSPFFSKAETDLILSEKSLKKQLATLNQQIKFLNQNGNLLHGVPSRKIKENRVKLYK